MPRLSKAAINAAFKPLSHALLREGRTNIQAEIAGFKVIACRQYQTPGCVGPAWNPHYRVFGEVEWNGRTVGSRSGTRDEMVEWLHRNQRPFAMSEAA